MTIPTQVQVDTWRAACQRLLAETQAGLFDLIDCGPAIAPVTARPPSARDRDATDTADGRFNPTTKSQSRRTQGQPSNPTLRAVIGFEDDVQTAVTSLYEVVSAVEHLAGHLGLTPADGFGDHLERPAEPATRLTNQGTAKVDVGLLECRRAVQPAIVWLGAVYDELADRMRGCDDPEVGDLLGLQSVVALRDLRGLARRVGGDRPRLCACGCRRVAPPVGKGATRGDCRQRLSEERKAS